MQIRELQRDILSMDHDATLSRERTEYDGLKQQLRDQDKAKADMDSFLRRTRDFEALRDAKKEQLATINKSRVE